MFQIAWVIVTIILCICSYYLGAINTWRKASKHVIRLAAQHGVHLTDGGLGDFEGGSNAAIGK